MFKRFFFSRNFYMLHIIKFLELKFSHFLKGQFDHLPFDYCLLLTVKIAHTRVFFT